MLGAIVLAVKTGVVAAVATFVESEYLVVKVKPVMVRAERMTVSE